MTDLQVKYATLQEQKRANMINEEEKRRSNLANERLKEVDVTSQVPVRSGTVEKLKAEIEKIAADTELTETQKHKVISDTVLNYAKTADLGANIYNKVVGILQDPMGVKRQVSSLFDLLGSGAKTAVSLDSLFG